MPLNLPAFHARAEISSRRRACLTYPQCLSDFEEGVDRVVEFLSSTVPLASVDRQLADHGTNLSQQTCTDS